MEEITNKKTNFYTIPLKYIVGCNIINTHKSNIFLNRQIFSELAKIY